MLERVSFGSKEFAIILRTQYRAAGIQFFTPDEFSQQLAYMSHKKGKEITPHIHRSVKREVLFTQETLFIRKGKLQVDFYREDQTFIESRILERGDVILLIKGGHGFKVLEDLEMFEVKQGPYAGDEDKIKFIPQ